MKAKPIRSKKLRDSARDQECTVQIPGICNGDTSTTVLAHIQFEGGGMGTKPSDVSACFACSDCHDVIDGRVQSAWAADMTWIKSRAVLRTLGKWVDMGLVTVK